jgi:DNA helicase-2/ATP-dependent DNA helicase PcrA
MDLAELDAEQRAAVMTDAGPLAIIAPAGSGKTRVLTARIARRIADGTASSDHVLALTFTRRAARELTGRLRGLGLSQDITSGTFHAVAWLSLQRFWDDRRMRPRTLLDRPDDLVTDIARDLRVNRVDLTADLVWAQARAIGPDELAASVERHGRRLSGSPEVVADAMVRYAEAKRASRVMDFGDLLAAVTELLNADRVFREVEHWRYRHLFVDEFQDLNPSQHQLLEAWRGGRPDLCVVGDPHQAIYGWNGADPAFLDEFTSRYAQATVIRLRHNYRTPAAILSSAHRALGVDDDTATAVRDGGLAPSVETVADEDAEASRVGDLLTAARPPGAPWRSCAVLARTHAQLAFIERHLATRGIPCQVRTTRSRAPWWDRSRDESLRSIVDELESAGDVGDDEITAVTAPTETEHLELARTFLRSHPDATLGQFAPWIELSPNHDGVDLVTFHAAKGLEWSTVIIVGAEIGFIPMTGTFGPARDEERRLLYVAMTRARRQLHVTAALRRGGHRRQLSDWLSHVGQADPAVAPPRSGRPRWAAPAADPLVGALTQWRAIAARSGRCDPRAVLSDEMLHSLAADPPGDPNSLRARIGAVKASRFGDALLAVLSGPVSQQRGELVRVQRDE